MITIIIILCALVLALGALALWYRRKWKTAEDVMATKENEHALYHEWADGAFEWYEGALKDAFEKNDDLHARLLAISCPHNAHIWDTVNGVKRCRRCGIEARSNA